MIDIFYTTIRKSSQNQDRNSRNYLVGIRAHICNHLKENILHYNYYKQLIASNNLSNLSCTKHM